MGVVLDQSKPRGLDVGVLTHAFLLFFVISFSSLTLLLRSSRWILRLVDIFWVRIDAWGQSSNFCRVVFVHFGELGKVMIRGLSGSISDSWTSFRWIGGGPC